MVFTWFKSVQWFQRYSLLYLGYFSPPFTTYVCKKPYATRRLMKVNDSDVSRGIFEVSGYVRPRDVQDSRPRRDRDVLKHVSRLSRDRDVRERDFISVVLWLRQRRDETEGTHQCWSQLRGTRRRWTAWKSHSAGTVHVQINPGRRPHKLLCGAGNRLQPGTSCPGGS